MSFEDTFMSYFQRVRQQCKAESFYTTGTQKRIDAYSVDGFCVHRNTVFDAMVCYNQYCPYGETRPSFTEEEIQRCIKNRELDERREQHTRKRL